jgi:hypothetical protein
VAAPDLCGLAETEGSSAQSHVSEGRKVLRLGGAEITPQCVAKRFPRINFQRAVQIGEGAVAIVQDQERQDRSHCVRAGGPRNQVHEPIDVGQGAFVVSFLDSGVEPNQVHFRIVGADPRELINVAVR